MFRCQMSCHVRGNNFEIQRILKFANCHFQCKLVLKMQVGKLLSTHTFLLTQALYEISWELLTLHHTCLYILGRVRKN